MNTMLNIFQAHSTNGYDHEDKEEKEDISWEEKLASAAEADFDDRDWNRYEKGSTL